MSDDTSTAISPTLQRTAETIEWPLPGGELVEGGDRERDRLQPFQTGTVLAVSETPARDYYVEALDTCVAFGSGRGAISIRALSTPYSMSSLPRGGERVPYYDRGEVRVTLAEAPVRLDKYRFYGRTPSGSITYNRDSVLCD